MDSVLACSHIVAITISNDIGSVDELAHILSPSSLIGITLGDVEQSDLSVCIWGCNKTGVCEWVADDHGRELCFVYIREEQRSGCLLDLG